MPFHQDCGRPGDGCCRPSALPLVRGMQAHERLAVEQDAADDRFGQRILKIRIAQQASCLGIGHETQLQQRPGAVEILENSLLEPGLQDAVTGQRFQFERLGYFCPDPEDSRPEQPVFNRIVTLKDTWGKAGSK